MIFDKTKQNVSAVVDKGRAAQTNWNTGSGSCFFQNVQQVKLEKIFPMFYGTILEYFS